MNEKLGEFIENFPGMLPQFQVELLRMNARFTMFRKIAKKYQPIEVVYELDDYEGQRYIMMEGTYALGQNPKLTMVHLFKMCAEMQYEEDSTEKTKAFMVGNPLFVMQKKEGLAYFRVDLPFSSKLIKVLGNGPFFQKFLDIISEG